MGSVLYGDITPRTAAYVVKELLKRGMPLLVFERFGQAKPLPMHNTKSMQFRRYFLKAAALTSFTPADYFTSANFDPLTKQLQEGVTPDATALDKMDLLCTLIQYGDRIELSDVCKDTHEDPVLQEAIELLGEQAPIILEKARFLVIRAGTNVVYSNGVARTSVNTVFTAAVQRTVTRTLKRQLAKPITSIVRASVNYGTDPIAPSFVAICHPDLEYNLRKASGFVPIEKYASGGFMEGEIGKISDVRYILTTIVEPFRGGGATGGTNVIETSSKADVYPIIYLAKDAYGLVPLKGGNSIVPMIVNAKPSDSDPMAQRNHAAWKAMQTTIILNDFWMCRAEVACTADGYLTD